MSESVKLDLSGLKRIRQNEPDALKAWFDGFTEDMVSRIKLSFGTSPDGETYTRGGVEHVASVPGYPPNVDIGALMGSIRWEPEGDLKRVIMDGVEYGIHLEDVLNRPFMAPVFTDAQKRIGEDARRNLGLESL